MSAAPYSVSAAPYSVSAAPYDESAVPYGVSAALYGVLALQDTHGTSTPLLNSLCRVVFAIGRHLKWAPGVLLLQKLYKQIFFPQNFNMQIFSPQDHFY